MRWGGEEFLIVSRYTDRTEAELLAQRVLSAVADTPFKVGRSGETITRTCSLGWAAFPWIPSEPGSLSYEEVITLADRGLNQAKRLGKNRAVGMQPPPHRPATASTAISAGTIECQTLQTETSAVAGPGENPRPPL